MANDDDDFRDDPPPKRGRGHPPVEHRFQPKVSGNPKGRPPNKKPEAPKIVLHDDFILKEAARVVAISEDGQPLTAEQALMRATLSRAIKGHAGSQRVAATAIQGANKRKEDKFWALFGNFVEIRHRGEQAIADNLRKGLPPPVLDIHPDDILIDADQACVWVYGGVTAEQRAARAAIRKIREEQQLLVTRLQKSATRSPKDDELKVILDEALGSLNHLESYNLDSPRYFGLLPEDQVRPPPPRATFNEMMRNERRSNAAQEADVVRAGKRKKF